MSGFHRYVGFAIEPKGSSHGICRVSGQVEERHLNINRVVHGGVYATLLDTAMGGAVVSTLTGDESTATTSLYVDFVRSARLGQYLTATGTLTRRGRHIAFADGVITDEEGVVLGRGHGTWYIWEHAGSGILPRHPPRRT